MGGRNPDGSGEGSEKATAREIKFKKVQVKDLNGQNVRMQEKKGKIKRRRKGEGSRRSSKQGCLSYPPSAFTPACLDMIV